MGRPRKFSNGHTNINFKVKPELKEIAKQKAENNNETLSEVLRSYLKTYTDINSDIEELKEKKQEAEKEVKEAKERLDVIEKQLESEKNKIPEKYVWYWNNRLGEKSKEDQEEWIEDSARNLGMGVDEFKKRMKEMVDDGGSG